MSTFYYSSLRIIYCMSKSLMMHQQKKQSHYVECSLLWLRLSKVHVCRPLAPRGVYVNIFIIIRGSKRETPKRDNHGGWMASPICMAPLCFIIFLASHIIIINQPHVNVVINQKVASPQICIYTFMIVVHNTYRLKQSFLLQLSIW